MEPSYRLRSCLEMTRALRTISTMAAAVLLPAAGCSISDDATIPASAPYYLNISGTVFDNDTREPVIGAVISLESYKKSDSNFTSAVGIVSTTAGDDGRFSVNYLEKESDIVYLIKAAGPASSLEKYFPYSTILILNESSPAYNYLKNTYTIDEFVIGLKPSGE